MRCHLGAPVAAHGHDREAIVGFALTGIEIVRDVIVHDPQQLVDQVCIVVGDRVPGARIGLEPLGELGLPGGERVLERGHDGGPRVLRAVARDQLADAGDQRTTIDDRPGGFRARIAHSGRTSLAY